MVTGSIPVSRSQEKIRDIERYLLFFSRSRGDLEPGVRSHPPKVGFGRFHPVDAMTCLEDSRLKLRDRRRKAEVPRDLIETFERKDGKEYVDINSIGDMKKVKSGEA